MISTRLAIIELSAVQRNGTLQATAFDKRAPGMQTDAKLLPQRRELLDFQTSPVRLRHIALSRPGEVL
jgi:hypothetical protein